MKRRALHALAPALAGLAAATCGGDPVPPLTPVASGPAPVAAAPAFPSPARWDYHPPAPERSVARVRQPDGSCIVVTEGGQRWKTAKPGSGGAAGRECGGPAVASATLAPEELEGVVRLGATSWMFVGVSGTLYPAAEALGPLTRAIAPPEPVGRVVGGAQGILAVTVDGRMFRWEESQGWKAISREGWPELGAGSGAGSGTGAGTAGVHLPRVLDLAANEEGVLALGFPETVFASKDMGQTWAALGAPAIGAQRVGRTLEGKLGAEGINESIVWTPDRTPPFSRVKEPLDDLAELVLSVGRGPSAGAVVGGRAAMDADRYYEAAAPGGAEGPWVLAHGRIEGRLEDRVIPGSVDCEGIKLGAAGKHVVMACERAGGESQEVRRSDDAGATWSEPLTLAAPEPDVVSIAVAPDGDALVAGMCKPPALGGSCKATAPLLVRLEGRKLVIVAAASELNGTAVAPAFSASGLAAYFLGRRAKDDRLALFVSQDGGFSFAQRSLDAPSTKSKPEVAREEEPEDTEREPAADDLALADTSAIRPGDDGTVGIVLRRSQGLAYVTTDENGKVQYIAAAPGKEAEPVLAGHGGNVLAASVESDGVFVWESRNGGATWSELPPSIAVMHEVVQGNMPIACGSHGCLLGETVSRLGWGGQSEPLGPDLPEEPSPKEVPAVRTPIACELEASSRWVRIEHVDPPDFRAAAPDVNQAMRGRSVWSVVSWDKPAGALSVVSAMLPPSGEGEARVVTRPLLARPPAGTITAADMTNQMEGYAVGRVRLPDVGAPPPPPARAPATPASAPKPAMRDFEVAWENWMDGTSGRVKIADAGVFETGSIATDGDQLSLRTTLLSVSPGGIFVRPQSPKSASPLAMFLRSKGEPDRFNYPSLPERSWGKALDVRRHELAMAGGQPIGVGIVAQGGGTSESLYVLAHRPPSTGANGAPSPNQWDIQAVALAPAAIDRKLLFESGWTYSGSTVGVTSFFSDPLRSHSWAYFQPFRADGTLGPAEPLPTLLDTGDEPRPCKAAERATTAHFEALLAVRNQPTSAGTRHPVLITEVPAAKGATPGAPLELLTWNAVLHGTPAAPCVAAWDARGMGQLQMNAILSGDLAHSWAFRPAPAPDTAGDAPPAGAAADAQKKAAGPKPFALEYRPMSCRFDKSAKIPESVWAEPATSRFER